MRWRKAGPAFCVLLAAGILRCSLFVDTDGLSGGGSTDAATLDGTSDVLVDHDAGTIGDGGVADGAIATDSGFGGCDASHAICDDFDDTPALTLTHWTDDTVYGDGSVELVSDASVSAPHSFHSTAPANTNGAGAALYKNFTQAISRAHCEAQVLVRAGRPQTLAIEFAGSVSTDQDYYATVYLGGAGSKIAYVTDYYDGGADYNESNLPNLTVGEWTHISLDIVPSGTAETVVVTVGTASPHTFPFAAPKGATLMQIDLGEDYSTNGFDALFDNALCDVTP